MKDQIIALIEKLLEDVRAIAEDDKDAIIASLNAQLVDLQSKLSADEAKISKAKEDLA